MSTGIGARFKQLRKSLAMSQAQFSSTIGVSQGTLSEIEKEKFKPSVETVISTSEHFGVKADWLLRGDFNSPTNNEKSLPFEEDLNSGLAPEENELLQKYQLLTHKDKKEIQAIMDLKLNANI